MKNKYLVALATGGVMEMPEFKYSDPEVIEAESCVEAEKEYNKKHNCSYFYGSAVAQLVDGKIKVIENNIKVAWLEMLKTNMFFIEYNEDSMDPRKGDPFLVNRYIRMMKKNKYDVFSFSSKEEMDKFVTEFGNQARHGVSDFQEYSKEEMQEMIKQASEWYGTKDENHQITIKESGKYSISYTCDLSGTPVHMETRKLKAGDLINIDKL